MAIDRELIEKKLDILEEFIVQIERMDFNKQQLVEDKDTQQLLSFRFQQAVETAIDIATHLIAGLSLERKETAKDAFRLLGEKKIITSKLAEKMALASDFRNLVVHGYQRIDFGRFFADYRDDLADLRRFAQEINSFIEKN